MKTETRLEAAEAVQEALEEWANSGTKDQTGIGVAAKISSKVSVNAELTSAEVGSSALVGLTAKVDEKTSLYGTYTMSPDHAPGVTNTLAVGAATEPGDCAKTVW